MSTRRVHVVALSIALLAASCTSAEDASIVIDANQIDPQVENGTAYAQASVPLASARVLDLPQTATVRYVSTNNGMVELFMAKNLRWAGHPSGQRVSIRDERSRLGVATTVVSDTLLVGTQGEWANMEGGADVKLLVLVPAGVHVELRKGLSGPFGAAQPSLQRNLDELKRNGTSMPPEMTIALAEGLPTAGWTRLVDRPDPSRTAR